MDKQTDSQTHRWINECLDGGMKEKTDRQTEMPIGWKICQSTIKCQMHVLNHHNLFSQTFTEQKLSPA